MPFEPDYRHFEAVMQNRRPARLPLYEHLVNVGFMELALGVTLAPLQHGTAHDRREFYRTFCDFFRQMTYDVVSFEICIGAHLEQPTALSGGKGLIQTRADFEAYPWDAIPARFWAEAAPAFRGLTAALPPGMRAVGGVGNGVFELAESLVGLEYLPFIQADDPELYVALFGRIGNLMHTIWERFLREFASPFIACRFGDDLGYKASLLTNPDTVRDQILPQYRRLIALCHRHGKPFLWHSCGNVFEIMPGVLAAGIDAKHSNEDAIAPFDVWLTRFGARIGFCGGFDLDLLCSRTPAEIEELVFVNGSRYRQMARGYALGSGNSIPEYVPLENYRAMIRGAERIRAAEAAR